MGRCRRAHGGAALSSGIQTNPGATSVIIRWNPVNTSITSPDGDFYDYRLYIRRTADTVWNQWDGDDDAFLRDTAPGLIVNNVDGTTGAFGFTATGEKYTTISGLDIFTDYDFYITAVDIFGNESPVPGSNYTFKTTPFSVEASVSDGITSFSNTEFIAGASPVNDTSRQLRETTIRVKLRIVTTGPDPDLVRVWYTNVPYSAGTETDIVDGSGLHVPNSGGFAPDTLDSAEAIKQLLMNGLPIFHLTPK